MGHLGKNWTMSGSTHHPADAEIDNEASPSSEQSSNVATHFYSGTISIKLVTSFINVLYIFLHIKAANGERARFYFGIFLIQLIFTYSIWKNIVFNLFK